jgi:hypothetical protein
MKFYTFTKSIHPIFDGKEIMFQIDMRYFTRFEGEVIINDYLMSYSYISIRKL